MIKTLKYFYKDELGQKCRMAKMPNGEDAEPLLLAAGLPKADPPCFIFTVGRRWLQGVFGELESQVLPAEQPFIHHLPGRPHPALVPGSQTLWVNRSRPASGAGHSRFLGSAVVDVVRRSTPGELRALYGDLPSAMRSVTYRLVADAGRVLTAVICRGWVGFDHPVTPGDALQVGLRLSSGDRAFREAVRIGTDQYEALWRAGREGPTS